PGAVLGKRLQGLPVVGAVDADEGLGDGVLLDVQRQSSDPLDEALLTSAGEAHSEGQQDGLPEQTQLGSFHLAPPGVGLSAVTTDRLAPGGVVVNQSGLKIIAGGFVQLSGFTRNHWL